MTSSNTMSNAEITEESTSSLAGRNAQTGLLHDDERRLHEKMADLLNNGMKGSHMCAVVRAALDSEEFRGICDGREENEVNQLVSIIANEFLVATE